MPAGGLPDLLPILGGMPGGGPDRLKGGGVPGPADAGGAGLRAAWQGLYDDLAGGRVDWLSYHIGPVLYVLTRGIRPGAEVTRSVFWNTGGGLEAVSHHDFSQFDFSEMPDGVTVNAG